MVQELREHVEEIHYTALHTALEQYLGRDIPGSLTYAHYPEDDAEWGNVMLVFTVPTEMEDNTEDE